MKKIFISLLAVVLVASFAIPAFAATVSTDINVVSDGVAPIVKCKWEEGAANGVADDTSAAPGLQIDQNPGSVDCSVTPSQILGTVEVCYYAVVTHPVAMSLVGGVYADVYHPEVMKEVNLSRGFGFAYAPEFTTDGEWCGSHKYQIELDMILENDNNAAVAAFQAAYAAGLVTLNGFTPADIIEELLQGEAELYKGCEVICTHQPAGEYRVDIQAASGSAWSQTVTNILTVNALNSFLVDFTGINYGMVAVGHEKQIGGDDNMCTPDKATIWNNGNTYINLTVAQDDAGFGQRSTSSGPMWNVHWAARMGDEQEGTKIAYDPNQAPVTLPETLIMCTPTKLDFFITVDKAPNGDGAYAGTMTLGSTVVDFIDCVD